MNSLAEETLIPFHRSPLAMDADRVGNSHSQTLGSSSLAGRGPTIAAPVPIIGPEGNSTSTFIRHSSPLSDQGDASRSDTSYAPLRSAQSLSNSPLPPLPGHDPISPGRNPLQRSDTDWVHPIIDWAVPVEKVCFSSLTS